jgi:hypothetical protein
MQNSMRMYQAYMSKTLPYFSLVIAAMLPICPQTSTSKNPMFSGEFGSASATVIQMIKV